MVRFQWCRVVLLAITLALLITLCGAHGEARAAGSVTLSVAGSPYGQDFDTLALTGTSNTAVPTGWDFFETGTNANTTYSAGTGSINTGDTYSFGATSSTERAFGCLRSGSLVPRVGVQFTNSTGGVITTLAITYAGEQWRLGATGRADRLDFQLSTSATSLADGPAGTWVDYDALDFSSPVTTGTAGALNGNAASNRAAMSLTITGLNIPNGGTFWIRWSDFDASGADDGLAVDDFSLTAVNNAPTDIALSPNTVAENAAANTVVGAFSTTDPDTGNTFTYTLVTGAGSADNASFNITAGGSLRTSASFDYEAKNSYAIRVRSTDQGNLWFEKQFTITVSDVGEAPTDIALSNASVPENAGANAVVGTLSGTDPDLGQSATLAFSLPAGLTDNALFNISSATLRATDSLDYEVAASYTVTVRATDAVGLFYDETFTITVTDVFDPPSGSIALTALGATHAEDFNSLASSGSSGTVPSGWYFVEAGTSTYVNTAYRAGIGSSNIGDTYSFGNSADRAFGCLFSNTLTPLLGAQFTNSTGVTIQALTVFYMGEQWRLGETGRADRLDFELSTDATSLTTGSWVDYDSLDFSSPVTAGTVGAQNGNDPANRTAMSSTITGLSIANGSTFWIRWADYDVPGSDDGLAVDDFSLVPYTSPTDIALSNASVPENAGANAVVGTLSGTDPDLGQSATLAFSLPAGLTDNALFNISSATLRATDSLDYEVAASYTVTVRATDAVGLFYDETFTITVTDVNETPTITSDGGGATAAVSVAENSTAVTTVTASDPDQGTTLTYTIAGGADQAKFTINGSSGALTFVGAPDFETPTDVGANNVYEVTVEASDGSLTDTQAISVTVTDANEAPTDIALSNASVPENAGANAVVGTLSGTDPDLGQSATLAFSLPAGLTDNALFNISSATLRATDSLDYEVAASYTVTVRATDAVGLFYDETFTITVTDVNETPTITSDGGGATAAVSVAENSTAVTTVTASDPDQGTTLTYTIAGGADQAKFTINGSSGALTFVGAPDFETPTDVGANNVYEVTVEASDGSLTDTQAISVTVTDANEAPTDIALSNASVPENAGANAVVGTLSGTDPDLGQSATLAFSLPAGLTDNALFNISSATLRATDSLDYEVAASYTVTVRATDAVGLFYDETFTITVTDVAAVYTLTYVAGKGGSIVGASPQTVEPGQDGTKVTAIPNPGYHFYRWSDGVTTASRIDTNVMADKSVKALFAPDAITHPHTLTYTAGVGGSIAGANLQIVEHGGDGTEVTAVPDPGYRFVAWSDGVLTTSRTDTNVRADLTVMAEFALAPDRWTDITNQQWVDVYGVTADEVDAVADGYSDGTFRPSLPVNRAQFSKMVVDGFGLPKLLPIVPSFSDVPVAHFFYEWIEGAAGAGIVTGYPDGSFRPDQTITRQQANSILGRYLSHKELANTGAIQGDLGSYASVAEWYVAEGAAVLAPFADASQLAPVHAPFTAYLVYHEVVLGSSSGGSTYLTPLSELTRAQAAVMVVRIKQ